MGSTDGTIEIAQQEGCGLRDWDTGDKVDDTVNTRIKTECWIGSTADWVIVCDADEFIYFPGDREADLLTYLMLGVPIIRPEGYEMTAWKYPTTSGQIYDEVRHGAPDHHWYGKPCIFTPHLVKSMWFAPGHHKSRATLHDGSVCESPSAPTVPIIYLLHYHHIGSIERIAEKYDRTRARMCETNIRQNWGNFEPGIKHATDKRNAIMQNLRQVIR